MLACKNPRRRCRPHFRCVLLMIIVGTLGCLYSRAAIAETPRRRSASLRDVSDASNTFADAKTTDSDPPFNGQIAGQMRADNELALKLMWCPPGTFVMGSWPGETVYRKNESRVEVTFSRGFWIGKYEVTQREWEAIMETNPSEFSPTGSGKYKVLGKTTTQFPAESMLVEEAIEFCDRLTDREFAAGRLPAGWMYTLPTEAQWEYACRAGTTTGTAFGDQLCSVDANFKGFVPYNDAKRGPYLFRPTDVGSYRANAWGVHDMHGNVWEYCAGWYADEAPGGTNPEPATSGVYRIGKGGSWLHDGRYTRSAFRYWIEPTVRQGTVGFRVALTQTK